MKREDAMFLYSVAHRVTDGQVLFIDLHWKQQGEKFVTEYTRVSPNDLLRKAKEVGDVYYAVVWKDENTPIRLGAINDAWFVCQPRVGCSVEELVRWADRLIETQDVPTIYKDDIRAFLRDFSPEIRLLAAVLGTPFPVTRWAHPKDMDGDIAREISEFYIRIRHKEG